MSNLRAARRYAVALLDSAADPRALDATVADLTVVESAVRTSRELQLLLASPVIQAGKKSSIVTEIFGGKIGHATVEFLLLLINKHREHLLADIITQFQALRNERLGIVTIEVSSAVALSDAQQRALQARLGEYTKKNVQVRFTLDNAVKGGLVIRIGDTVLDASLRRQLDLLRERFVAGGELTN